MRLFYKFSISVSLLMALLIFLQIPITKFPTTHAMKLIEEHLLPQDLTSEEKSQYNYAKEWILRNDSASYSVLTTTKYLGLGVCLILLIQNVISLRHEIQQTRSNMDTESARKMREDGLM